MLMLDTIKIQNNRCQRIPSKPCGFEVVIWIHGLSSRWTQWPTWFHWAAHVCCATIFYGRINASVYHKNCKIRGLNKLVALMTTCLLFSLIMIQWKGSDSGNQVIHCEIFPLKHVKCLEERRGERNRQVYYQYWIFKHLNKPCNNCLDASHHFPMASAG